MSEIKWYLSSLKGSILYFGHTIFDAGPWSEVQSSNYNVHVKKYSSGDHDLVFNKF